MNLWFLKQEVGHFLFFQKQLLCFSYKFCPIMTKFGRQHKKLFLCYCYIQYSSYIMCKQIWDSKKFCLYVPLGDAIICILVKLLITYEPLNIYWFSWIYWVLLTLGICDISNMKPFWVFFCFFSCKLFWITMILGREHQETNLFLRFLIWWKVHP